MKNNSTLSEGWEIEKKLNEVLVNYNWSPVSDYSGSMFKEMKKLISDLLSTQKESFIKIIESNKRKEKECGCFWGGCGCRVEDYNQALDDIKAELEREDR